MNWPNQNPYAAPQTAEPTTSPYKNPSKRVPPFRAATSWATMARIMLGVSVLGELASAATSLYVVSVLGRVQRGLPIAPNQAEAVDILVGMVAILNLFFLIITGITFLVWFHHAHRNLGSLRPYGKLEFSPGWAAGSFFVPILNLFRPYQIMREVWRHSDPRQLDRHKKEYSPLAGWWWAGWITANVLSNISGRMSGFGTTEDISVLIAAGWVEVVEMAISIPTAIVLIFLISRIDANQTERYELVLQTPKPAPPGGPQNPWENQPSPAGFPQNWGGQFGERG